MGTTLTIRAPSGYDLARDVCSYGYFLLAPNHWDTRRRRLLRVLNLQEGPALASITQPGAGTLRARFDRRLARAEHHDARARIARMTALDMGDDEVRAFHKIDPRWKKSGRARLFRSPTLFEDIIKTVTSCNVTWPSTVHMNTRLCEVCGRRSPSGAYAFPSAKKLARTRPATLRGRCRVGYRDARIVALAKLFARGAIDEEWLHTGASDDEAFGFLITLPGIGPYAAANVMQLMGRTSRLALDTESVRHAREVLGMTGEPGPILARLETHYEPFGAHRFRSYWFELWDFYESKAGPAHAWERETSAAMFTAANLK